MRRKFKSNLVLWPDEANSHEVLRGLKSAFTTKIIGSALAFSFNLALGRLLGAEGAGLYFLAFSITAIGSVFGRIGLDNVLVRFVAIHTASGEWQKMRALHALCLRITVVLSGVIALLGFFTADFLASSLFKNSELAAPLSWMSLSILPLSILNLYASSLKGLKRVSNAITVESIGVPLIGLLLIYPFAQSLGTEGASWTYLLATSLVAFLGAWIWQKANHHAEVDVHSYPFSSVWKSSKPLFIVALANILATWTPLILLGIWVEVSDVGVFGAAMRLSLLISLLLLTLNNVTAPKYAELHSQGNVVAMGEIARRSTAIMVLVVSPLFFIMFIFSDQAMSLYGVDFASGGTILMILLVGQLVNIVSGSVSVIMMMAGYERTLRNIVIGTAVLQFVLILNLAPYYGTIGVAAAVALTMIIKNLLTAYKVYRKLGFVAIPYPHFFSAKKNHNLR